MAITPIRIPHLTQAQPIVDKEGRMTAEFHRRLNDILQSLGSAILAVQQIPLIQQALEDAQAAAATAQAAADAANAAAGTAGDAADAAAAAAAANAKEQALVNSYILPASVLTATPTIVTVAEHTRYYGDGTSVVVNGGSRPATAAGTVSYVSYNDPTRAGGAVTYQASTTQPTQGMGIHVVGAVTIPTTGSNTGGSGPSRPGSVEP